MSFLKTHLNSKTACRLSALVLLASISISSVSAAELRQKAYASPEEASMALLNAAQSGDEKRIREVFGRQWKSLGSGDPVLAKREREAFAAAYNEKHEVRLLDETRATLVLGKEEWPVSLYPWSR
jgi:predicted membrane-bound mannosyltransferase